MTRFAMVASIIFLCLGTSGSSGSEPGHGHDELTRYPTYGAAFKAPRGWAEQTRDKGKTIVRWISPDSVPAAPSAMIMIECARPVDRSLDKVAQGLAQNFHGTVADRPTTLGGTLALRITAKNDAQSLRPVEGLATIHDGLVYLVMGAVKAGHSVANDLEVIRASWSWMPIEPPYKHLKFRDEPLSFVGGAAAINVPALMHVYPTEHPDRILDLGLHNVLRNEPDFLAYVQIAPMAKGQTLDDLKNRLSKGLLAKYKLKVPIEWRAPGSQGIRVVSQAIGFETPEEVGGPKRMHLMWWALVKIDDDRIVMVNFTQPINAPKGGNTYNDLVDRIVESIRPGVGGERARETMHSCRP